MTSWRLIFAMGAVVLAPRLAFALPPPPSPAGIEVSGADGSSWDAILRDIQSDPATLGRTCRLRLRVSGEAARCGDYQLTLDPVGARGLALGACDTSTGLTELRVVDRAALFDAGDVVPTPLPVSIHATLTRAAVVSGGGADVSASTTIACTLSLQPYLWDGLRGVRAPLSPDRYDLIPLDERVDAERDALGWTVHGKAHVHTMFRYEVRDRRTGRTVLSDVAQLDCSDRPVDAGSTGTWSNAELLRTLEASFRPLPDACSRRALGGATCFEGDGLSPVVLDHGAGSSTDASRPTVGLGLGLLVGGASFASSTVYLARVGLQAGVGGFVSDRVYVGGAVGSVMATDVESGELAFAGQVGPEVRIGLRPMKGGHGVRVSPLGTWIGFKAGYQTAGLGPEGGFVEASLGLPVLALTAGVDVGPPRSGGEGAFVEPYLGLSLHLDLGW